MDDLYTTVTLLINWFRPYLPHLIQPTLAVGVKVGETVVEKITEAFLERQAIWKKLTGNPESKKFLSAATNVVDDPKDEDYQNKLIKELTNLLQKNPDLLAEITQLIPSVQVTVAATNNSKVEDIDQTIDGKNSGSVKMQVTADNHSTVTGVKQNITNNK
jgi:hypothetical protein